MFKKLFGGGSKPDPQHQKEIASAEKLEDTTFTTKHGSQGVKNNVYAEYAASNPDLMANYEKYWKKGAKEGLSGNNQGISLAEFGAMHYHKYGRNEGRSLTGGGGGGESGGGGGSAGGYSQGYGTTNPYAGATGNSYLDSQSLMMMEMIKSLTASIEALGKVDDLKSDIDDVSKGASGIESTLLTGSTYTDKDEKKKKSHLTPIVVG